MAMRSRALLVSLVALACGAACKPRGAPTEKGQGNAGSGGGTLRVHMEAEPPSLNPLVEHDAWTLWLTLGAVYDPLVREGKAPGSFTPALAASWDQPDDRTLHLVLRRDVTWHDGHPFTVDDVIGTFDRLRDPGVSPDARADFDAVVSVEKKGEAEVVLKLGRPAPLLLQGLARLAILPAHLFGEGDLRKQPASRAPVGTGPFRFVSWQAGQKLVFERAPRAWDRKAKIERLEVIVARDREAAFELARRGAIDLLWQLTPSQVDRVAGDAALAGYRVVPWHLRRYGFIVWNTARPGLGDRRVRRALSMLVDRKRYLDVAYRGRAVPVTGPYPLDADSYDKTIAPWPFDPARARALLDEAGVKDTDGDGLRELPGAREPFRLAFLYNAGSPTLSPLVTLLQEDFKKAGVTIEAVPVDWAVMLDRLRKHAFDASSLLWVMQPVQDNYKEFHSSQAERGQNYGEWKHPEADRLLDALRMTPLGPARVALDRAFHRLVHEEQPYTFLGNPEIDSLVSTRVHGYAPRAADLGFTDLWLDPSDAGR